MSESVRPPVQFPEDSRVAETFGAYGNSAANKVIDGLNDGLIVRLLIGSGKRAFVADHVRLCDGRIAMTTSKWDRRRVYESTAAEVGYGVAKAHAYTFLEFDRSMFSTELEQPFSNGIDPETIRQMRPDEFSEERDSR